MSRLPLSLEHPGLFAAACALGLLAAAIARARRPAVSPLTASTAAIASALFALAAGGLTWHRPAESEVAVMVDLSASTRGAGYRDRAALDRRIRQLLGTTPYRVTYFAQENTGAPSDGNPLPDLAGDATRFAPPAAAAVLLFSDARFDLPPTAPPTFVVADPNLDRPEDAAVTRLELRGIELAATVASSGRPRTLTLSPAATTRPGIPIEPGSITVTRALAAGNASGVATARLDAADRWPENDALSLPLAPPAHTERWFVSAARPAPPGDWRAIPPDALPTDPAAYLAPAVIVLDNLAASDLSDAQHRLIEQYVRDLGGALFIAGGDRAFAPGLYAGTALEALSPLASVPPAPAIHWLLLADASGSMSQPAGDGATRWQRAASAVTRLLPRLPPEDPVSVGSFAADLTWWSTGRSARETAARAFPPPDVAPNGPTNLAAALERVARESDAALPTELLVVSDADVTIDRPDALAERLKSKRIRLHLLAIGDGRGLDALRQITAATGGTLRRQLDPTRWAADVRQLLAAASPQRLVRAPATLKFRGELAPLPGRAASPWSRTWLKPAATELARGTSTGETVPLAARWTVGAEGTVVATAFAPTPSELDSIARLIARPPHDPRFTVTWDVGPRLTVRLDAAAAGPGGNYLNDLPVRLELTHPDDTIAMSAHAVPQVAPGRYELALPAPRTPTFAALRVGGRIVDRVALPARYAPEFNAVGNDYNAMHRLANVTGGRVIDRASDKPLDLPFPRQFVPLTAVLTLLATAAVAAALVRWRVG